MIEKACYQRLDEPVLVWLGLEFHQIAIAIGVGAGTAVIGGFLLNLGFPGLLAGFGAGAGLIALFRALRSGGPGYVFIRLYRSGFLDLLPPGIRPRYLLPLFGSAKAGKVRLSPIYDPENRHGRRQWFGR